MDTWDGSWRKFVRGGGIGIWKTEAAEDTYIGVVGMAKKKREKGSGVWVGFGRTNVK